MRAGLDIARLGVHRKCDRRVVRKTGHLTDGLRRAGRASRGRKVGRHAVGVRRAVRMVLRHISASLQSGWVVIRTKVGALSTKIRFRLFMITGDGLTNLTKIPASHVTIASPCTISMRLTSGWHSWSTPCLNEVPEKAIA